MRMNPMVQFIRQISSRIGSGMYAGIQGQMDPRHISFLKQLQKETKEDNCLDIPLTDLQTVVFDFETTGFYPEKGDRILSIGAIKMHGEEMEEEQTFYSLVQSDDPLSKEMKELTNIQEKELKAAPPLSEVFLQFYQFIEGRTLVAHHAKHEQAFMKQANRELLRSNIEKRILDTSFFIRLVDPICNGLTLDECCIACGVEIHNRHHALEDAKMTAQLWRYYIKKAKEIGCNNLRDMYEVVAKGG